MERKLALEQAARAEAERHRDRLEASRIAAEEAKRAAEAAARRAEESNRVKDEFLATVSHELRTPLNAILGWSTLLRGKAAGSPFASGLDAICRNAQAQARIIEDILDVSRIITGKLRILPGDVDLIAIVKEGLEIVEPSAYAKRIKLSFEHEERAAKLVGDAERLRQVVWNLLSNAVKFTGEDGQVLIKLTRDPDGRIVLSVRDDGIGISPEFLPYVFDRFSQAESSTTRRFGGLGLGLSIVRHIVELHGGRVSVSSDGVGKGSTFTIVFPVRALLTIANETPNAQAKSPQLDPAAAARSRLAGVKALLVDDDDEAREMLSALLGDEGADVRTANSTSGAIEVFATFAPDVVISDIAMPDQDGYDLARSIRAQDGRGPPVPIVALSALTRGQDRVRAHEAGFSDYLSKPVDRELLIETIARLTQGPRRLAEVASG
jgi:signal transduction histidine kinase/ActR/RegA family two-component response regulator